MATRRIRHEHGAVEPGYGYNVGLHWVEQTSRALQALELVEGDGAENDGSINKPT